MKTKSNFKVIEVIPFSHYAMYV